MKRSDKIKGQNQLVLERILEKEKRKREKKKPADPSLELEVQYQYNGNNENGNDGTNDPFVPVHSPGHGSQDSLAPPDIIVHAMKLQEQYNTQKQIVASDTASLSTHIAKLESGSH